MALCDSCGRHVVGNPSDPAIDCLCTQRCPNCMQPTETDRDLGDLCDTCQSDPAVPGALTGRQADVLAALEQVPAPRHGRWEDDHAAVLDQLAASGLVRRTVTNWTVTAAGRRALVAVDGRTRIAVQTFGRNAYDPPTSKGA